MPLLLAKLAHPYFSLVDPHASESEGEGFTLKCIGRPSTLKSDVKGVPSASDVDA